VGERQRDSRRALLAKFALPRTDRYPGVARGSAGEQGPGLPSRSTYLEEIILVMRAARPCPYADRARGLIVILWRGGEDTALG
jgi:hypothetical protein